MLAMWSKQGHKHNEYVWRWSKLNYIFSIHKRLLCPTTRRLETLLGIVLLTPNLHRAGVPSSKEGPIKFHWACDVSVHVLYHVVQYAHTDDLASWAKHLFRLIIYTYVICYAYNDCIYVYVHLCPSLSIYVHDCPIFPVALKHHCTTPGLQRLTWDTFMPLISTSSAKLLAVPKVCDGIDVSQKPRLNQNQSDLRSCTYSAHFDVPTMQIHKVQEDKRKQQKLVDLYLQLLLLRNLETFCIKGYKGYINDGWVPPTPKIISSINWGWW